MQADDSAFMHIWHVIRVVSSCLYYSCILPVLLNVGSNCWIAFKLRSYALVIEKVETHTDGAPYLKFPRLNRRFRTTPRMSLKIHLLVYNRPIQRRLCMWHSPRKNQEYYPCVKQLESRAGPWPKLIKVIKGRHYVGAVFGKENCRGSPWIVDKQRRNLSSATRNSLRLSWCSYM